jgi:hypothetical protein
MDDGLLDGSACGKPRCRSNTRRGDHTKGRGQQRESRVAPDPIMPDDILNQAMAASFHTLRIHYSSFILPFNSVQSRVADTSFDGRHYLQHKAVLPRLKLLSSHAMLIHAFTYLVLKSSTAALENFTSSSLYPCCPV